MDFFVIESGTDDGAPDVRSPKDLSRVTWSSIDGWKPPEVAWLRGSAAVPDVLHGAGAPLLSRRALALLPTDPKITALPVVVVDGARVVSTDHAVAIPMMAANLIDWHRAEIRWRNGRKFGVIEHLAGLTLTAENVAGYELAHPEHLPATVMVIREDAAARLRDAGLTGLRLVPSEAWSFTRAESKPGRAARTSREATIRAQFAAAGARAVHAFTDAPSDDLDDDADEAWWRLGSPMLDELADREEIAQVASDAFHAAYVAEARAPRAKRARPAAKAKAAAKKPAAKTKPAAKAKAKPAAKRPAAKKPAAKKPAPKRR